MDDSLLNEQNHAALESHDLNGEYGPDDRYALSIVCPLCDEDVPPDAERCDGCGWYRP